jgi:hypothetical protein
MVAAALDSLGEDFMFKRIRVLAVLLAVGLLAPSIAQAAPRLESPALVSESGGVLGRLRSWLASLVMSGLASQTKSVWDTEGSQSDPNG